MAQCNHSLPPEFLEFNDILKVDLNAYESTLKE